MKSALNIGIFGLLRPLKHQKESTFQVKNNKKSPKSKTFKIKASFNGGNLTNFSGLLPLHTFMQKIGFSQLLNSQLSIPQAANQIFSLSQIIQAIVLGILSGANRMIKIEKFTMDPLAQKLLNLPRPIDKDTLRIRLKKFTLMHTNELLDVIATMSQKIHRRLGTAQDILDMDSSVVTVYGHQQQSAKGYNPTHKGKKSYHPLFAFLNSTREVLGAWLRPGDVHTAHNAQEFLKETIARLPKNIKHLLIRADSGFFDDKIMSLIEGYEEYQYLIKVKLKNLSRLLSHQQWQTIPGMPGWQMCEWEHKGHGWKKSRRFVAVRLEDGWIDREGLFPQKAYRYFCYVTNIEESPLALHRLYGDRGESENWIEAVKNQLFGGQMRMNSFWGNEALLLMSVLAYNLSLWMRKLTSEKAWRQEPMTFRLWFIQLAGRLVSTGRRNYLKMYRNYYHQRWWLQIKQSVESLQFA